MKLLMIATADNCIKIENYINSYRFFLGMVEDVTFFNKELMEISPLQFDRVVMDEFHFDDVYRLYRCETNFENLYMWFNGMLVSVIHPQLFGLIMERAIRAKNWVLLKKINKIKIELNYIMRKEVLDTYPSQLQLESTSFCNAQCIMCSHYYAANRGALDMSEKMLSRLAELLPYLEILIMHGNGEPFSSKMFGRCVDTYAEFDIGLTTNTNLSILTDSQISRINQSFVSIRVSCDACTKEIYEGIRKNLSFERFIENAAKLRDLCPSVSKTMDTVLMRQNIEQIPAMVQFAAQYGFEEINFSNLGTSLIVGNEMDHIKHYPYYSAKQLRTALMLGQKLGIRVTIPNAFDLSLCDEEQCHKEMMKIKSVPFFKTKEEVEQIKKFAESVVGNEYRVVENITDCLWEDHLFACDGICEWCIEKPFIDLKGDVFVCCINASYRVGNLLEYGSFMDLWNNDVYRRIRKLFYEGKLPGFCDNCQFILNGSLRKLKVPSPGEGFYRRRHISKFYFDHCEEYRNEG